MDIMRLGRHNQHQNGQIINAINRDSVGNERQ